MDDADGPDIDVLLRAGLEGKSVLLLEDEMVFAMPIVEALYRVGVETIQHVQRGEIAVREGTQRAFDVLLFDRVNSGLDGLEALRSIRASGVGSHLAPALLVTATMNSQTERAFGLLTGADDYVDKAVGTTEILARTVNCMARARAQNAATSVADARTARNGPLIVKKTERRAYFDDRPLDLGTQGFDMLLALIEAPGQPFTRAMLFEIASPHWKGKTLPDGYEHLVHRAINRLRTALEPCEAGLPPALLPLVVTLRGQGYLLRDLRGNGVSDTAAPVS